MAKKTNSSAYGILAAVWLLTLGACTHMPDDRVEGLPQLKVTEHVLEPGEVFKHCGHAVTWWQWALLALPVACATIDFDKRTCDIYVASNTSQDTLEHERRHCQGYDHGDRIQNAVNAWRQNRPPVASLPTSVTSGQVLTPSVP